jgi:predicted porin
LALEETKAPVQSLENFEMKKTLVALAALASVSAFAQSTVTMYGIVDASYGYVSTDTGTTVTKTTSTGGNTGTPGALSSNRIGFKGTEDMGGGMKADFVYELGHSGSSDGALATTTARQSWVGVSGSLGAVSIGRQYNPIFSTSATYDAGGANNLNYGRVIYGKVATTRGSNLMMYTAPTMGGVTLKLSHGNDVNKVDNGTTTTGTTLTGMSAAYANGPLTVQYAHNKTDVLNNAAGDKTENLLGASYMVGKTTLMAMTGNTKTLDAAGAQSAKRTGTQLGMKTPVSGSVDAFLTYGTATVTAAAGSTEYKAKGTQAGLINNLSKRTSVYAIYGTTKDDGTVVKGTDYAIGLRHMF